MSRLPQPGGDSGNWGDILNDYLLVEHNANGTAKIRSDGTLAGFYSKPGSGIPESDLSTSVQTKLNATGGGGGAVTSVAGQVGDVILTENDIANLAADLSAKADASVVASKADASDLSTHISDTTSVHGIADTSLLATTAQVSAKYTKPGSGIPASDLDAATQSALTLAAARDAAKLQGTAINGSLPSDGQVLQYSNSSSAWVPATVTSSGSVSDATTGVKGIVQLSGDLAGTATSPTVPGLANKVSTAQVGVANGVASLGSDGLVPSSQLPTGAATPDASISAKGIVQLTGDLAGTAASPQVAKIQGVAISGTAAAGKVISATTASAATWTTLTKTSVGLSSVVNADTTNAANITTGTLAAGRLPALTGDVTTTSGTAATTLSTTGVTANTYTNANITVDAKGRITAASNGSAGGSAPDSTATVTGGVRLAGDLTGGSATVPKVSGIQGIAISATAPTGAGKVLTSTGVANAQWSSPTVPAATSTVAGGVQLAGDLMGGSAASPIVSGINGVAVTGTAAAGKVLTASNSTTASWVTPISGGGYPVFNFVTKTTAYTASNYDFVLADATSAAITITLPTPVASTFVRVKKTDSTTRAVSIDAGAATVNGVASITLVDQYAVQDFIADGTNWHLV